MKSGDKVYFAGRKLTLKEWDPRFLSWSFEELDINPVEYSRHSEPVLLESVPGECRLSNPVAMRTLLTEEEIKANPDY